MSVYSGKKVTRIGETLRNSTLNTTREEFDESMKVLSYWRFSHEEPLKVAMELLQKCVRPIESSAIFAKRPYHSMSATSSVKSISKA